MRHGADQLHLLRLELDRVRSIVERIVEAAHNPDCLSCAEVRRLGHEGLKPGPSLLDDWQT